MELKENTILKGKQLTYILGKKGDSYRIYDDKGLIARTVTTGKGKKRVRVNHYDWNEEQIKNLINSLNLKVINS